MFTQALMFNFPPHFRSFFQLVGDIEELREKEYDDTQGKVSPEFVKIIFISSYPG